MGTEYPARWGGVGGVCGGESHTSMFNLKLMFKFFWPVHMQFSLLSFVQIPDTFHKFYFSSTDRLYSNITVPHEFDLQLVYTKDFSFAFCCWTNGKAVYVIF